MTPPTFTYAARDRGGRLVNGELQGDTAAVVAGKLRERGLTPVAVDAAAGAGGLRGDLKIPGFSDRVKLKEVAVFSRQFATMVNSGLSLMRSLAILADQTEGKELTRIVVEVRNEVERGIALSVAMAKHPKAFDRLFIAMIRSGELGGMLDSVLLQMATTIEKQVELRRKVKSAMTYPAAVGGLVALIGLAMLTFVVPMFKNMYADLGGTLPLPTRILLLVSGAVTSFWYLVFGAGAAGVFAFRRWLATEPGRRRWDAVKLRLPVFGSLVHKTALARFSRSLSALVASGVPILDALGIVSETAGNAVLGDALDEARTAVAAGEQVSRPLAAHPVFPPMVVQMMAVGEETGATDQLLEKIADFYDREVEATVDALSSLMEPLLIAVMGVTVGGLVVALYMPMFNIVKLLE